MRKPTKGQTFTVFVTIGCGHRHVTPGLTELEAEELIESTAKSAFCPTCWRFRSTKEAWSQAEVVSR